MQLFFTLVMVHGFLKSLSPPPLNLTIIIQYRSIIIASIIFQMLDNYATLCVNMHYIVQINSPSFVTFNCRNIFLDNFLIFSSIYNIVFGTVYVIPKSVVAGCLTDFLGHSCTQFFYDTGFSGRLLLSHEVYMLYFVFQLHSSHPCILKI